MSKEILFKHIRSEDVVLWIGSGFSMYAGYPSGYGFRDIITAALDPSEKNLIDKHLPLADFAEEFVRLRNGSKNELIRLVRDTFGKNPTSLKDHETLAAIPHFKSIVTTNYDALLEKGYGDRGNLIFREVDISLFDTRKVNIIKVHGDLSDTESIVLTKSDYATFYRQDWSSPFWALLGTLMATKVILFIGYSLEDPNILAMLEHISRHLKQMRKQAYFIAPSVPVHRVAQLQRLGIEAIQQTGADFLAEVETDIRKHIFGDQQLQRVSIDTFTEFFAGKRLLPDFKSTPSGLQVTGIRTMDGTPAKGLMEISFTDPEVAKLHMAFINGETNEFVLKPSMFEHFAMNIEGIRMLGHEELDELRMTRRPVQYKIDLSFPGLGLELENLSVAIQRSVYTTAKIKIHNLDATIKISGDRKDQVVGNLSIIRNPIHANVNSAIAAYRFIKYFFTQQPFTIHIHDRYSVKDMKSDKSDTEFVREAERYLLYFQYMKKVEDFFGVRFRNITDMTNESLEILKRLSRISEGKAFGFSDGPVKITMTELTISTLELYQRLEKEDAPIDIEFNTTETVELHGQEIKLDRQRLHIPSARLLNLDKLQSGETREVIVESRTGKIYTFYHEPPRGLIGS